MTELRCNSKKHAELVDGMIEVKCNSRFCGAFPGIVVLHRYDTGSGELVETKKYKDPGRTVNRASNHDSAAVRTA